MKKLKYLIKIFIILNFFNQISSNFFETTNQRSEINKTSGKQPNGIGSTTNESDCGGHLKQYEKENCSLIASSDAAQKIIKSKCDNILEHIIKHNCATTISTKTTTTTTTITSATSTTISTTTTTISTTTTTISTTTTTISTISTTASTLFFFIDSFRNYSIEEIYKSIPNNTHIEYFLIDNIVSNNFKIFNQLNQPKLELLYGCLTNCSGRGSCKLINFEIRCDCQKDFKGKSLKYY